MYCHDCGTANTVDSKYCKECGTKINDGYRTMMLSVQDLPLDQTEETLDRLTRLLDMAFWHNEAGNLTAAITAAEAALAINPNSTTAHSLLGTLFEKKGDDAEAIRHLESVVALNPDSVADAAKLDQLRRGVRVKAAAPPLAHQLVPPALLKLGPLWQQRWAALAQTAQAGGVQRRPLYAAGAVTAGLLLGGLLLLRPWANAEANTHTVSLASSAAPPAVSVSQSAYAGGATPPSVSTSPRPIVLAANPSADRSFYPAPALTARDPFAGRPAPAAPLTTASPRWALPPVPRRTVAPRRLSERGLPPLRLAALPPVGSEGLVPAPVALPAGVGGPLVSVASIPQHTVVVSSAAGSASPDTSQPDIPSHIRITVHHDTEADVAPISSGDGQSSSQADSFQQRALALQQQGQYKQARLSYQSAIRAYEAQIASGRDVEAAQRGLAACQTGLQICQQSL